MDSNPTITPVIRILDEEVAKRFYLDWLGFSLDWEQRFSDEAPVYCQVSRRNVNLHLTGHEQDCEAGARIRIRVDDIATYHGRLCESIYRTYNPELIRTSWGSREMLLVDPFGNKLIFVEDIEE